MTNSVVLALSLAHIAHFRTDARQTHTMDTEISNRLPVDLHPTSRRPHVACGVNSIVAAQASEGDGAYLQRLLLVSVTRAIKMCATSALRFLLRLSPRYIRTVSRCSVDTDSCNRLYLAMQVAYARLVTLLGHERVT